MYLKSNYVASRWYISSVHILLTFSTIFFRGRTKKYVNHFIEKRTVYFIIKMFVRSSINIYLNNKHWNVPTCNILISFIFYTFWKWCTFTPFKCVSCLLYSDPKQTKWKMKYKYIKILWNLFPRFTDISVYFSNDFFYILKCINVIKSIV